MGDSKTWISRIPSLDKLGAIVPDDLDPVTVAEDWFLCFSRCIGDPEETARLLCPDALWRDLLALTWDIRTFEGSGKITTFLRERNSPQMRALKRKEFVQLQRPYPDLVWIVGTFEFDVDQGHGFGVFRLVPTATGEWKAFTIFTNLESLAGFPSAIGPLRSRQFVSGSLWAERLRQERNVDSGETGVLIVGAGQSALALAARLKYLGVSTLMVEKDPRVGDSWRNRYDALCLHFPVWNDHMPYLPSVLLENTMHRGNLRISTVKLSTNVASLHTRSKVFATGIGDGQPHIPVIPNDAVYSGETLHSSQYKRAAEYRGRKVLVIGGGNSGHDIASDLARSNIDVTMFQRSSTFVMNLDRQWHYLGGTLYKEGGPPLEIADNLFHSMPHLLLEGGMAQRSTKAIIDDYSDTLDKLKEVGFRTNSGLKDAGILLQVKERAGGHYFDTGGSQLIIDGKIKLKNDSAISTFYENGIEFVNGSRLKADVIIFATGVGDIREPIRRICGDEVADTCPKLLGVNDEGEMNIYRPLNRKGLWYIGEIKAMEVQLPVKRYM
ncbi:hypothetical protein DXG01_015996 [Tephrocybe rancida]|nr:hypothetical protein DXG01_015996 [Tephrocybe rancida]